MSIRTNVMLDDAVWAELKKVPKGERSRLVSQAVSETLMRRRAEAAARRMDELVRKMPRIKVDIVAELRRDRDTNHGHRL